MSLKLECPTVFCETVIMRWLYIRLKNAEIMPATLNLDNVCFYIRTAIKLVDVKHF